MASAWSHTAVARVDPPPRTTAGGGVRVPCAAGGGESGRRLPARGRRTAPHVYALVDDRAAAAHLRQQAMPTAARAPLARLAVPPFADGGGRS